MIKTFRDRRTVALFEGRFARGVDPRVVERARRKLRMVHAARSLKELAVAPGNRLEALSRDRKGQHSIRINDQFRIIFKFTSGEASEVKVTDYH